MTHCPARIPVGLDRTRPSVARATNHLLAGDANFAVDRAAVNALLAVAPELPALTRATRDWLHRVVADLARAGIDQFLDLGAGLPEPGHDLHVVAACRQPRTRVVHVDTDLVCVRHLQVAFPHCRTIHADLTDPATVLRLAQRHGGLDLRRPVAVLAGGIVHHLHLGPGEISAVTAGYGDLLAPGSALAISHYHRPPAQDRTAHQLAVDLQNRFLTHFGSGWFRTRDQIHRYFAAWPLTSPGLTYLDRHTDTPRTTSNRSPLQGLVLAGTARKT
ncbi:SAM-dependent methyltransferase [Nocardia takedensis]